MKNIILLTFCLFLLEKTSFGQSVTITPKPSNGVILDVKNRPAVPVNMDFGTSYGITIPKAEILPATPVAGLMVYYGGKVNYYNGSSWIALDSPNTLPVGAIVLNETKENQVLATAGYSMRGVTMLTYNPVNYVGLVGLGN